MCWDSTSGKSQWKQRLGGTFSSSPVLVNDLIFATNEEGQTFVFKASADKFQLVAENKLGDEIMSTPAICGGQIFQRIAVYEGDARKEYLVCIGHQP